MTSGNARYSQNLSSGMCKLKPHPCENIVRCELETYCLFVGESQV